MRDYFLVDWRALGIAVVEWLDLRIDAVAGVLFRAMDVARLWCAGVLDGIPDLLFLVGVLLLNILVLVRAWRTLTGLFARLDGI